MHLLFPNLDTLRLAITAGTIPPALASHGARFGVADDGKVNVETAQTLPKATETELRRLGVSIRKTGKTDQPVICWSQILPLERMAEPAVGDKTAVLFELHDDSQLAEIVGEMLRLGNDRQSYRWLENSGHACALLRVLGPPYYTLLRAVDPSANGSLPAEGATAAPRAYVEQSPRVWVEFGWSHPFAGRLHPPAGKILLLRAERDWLLLDEGRFHEIDEVIDFTFPASPAAWSEGQLPARIHVPLQLVTSDATEPAELWVLSGTGAEQLDELVQNADDHLLGRLSFAIGQQDGQSTVIVRARPGKTAPPVLVLDGIAYRPYLKLPNLFVASSTRLHPPLRRDTVKTLLAPDPDRVVWLQPAGGNTGRFQGFTPQSLPDSAFRPLSDWVDYVIDQNAAPLTAWMQAMRFEFEPFVCKDDVKDKPPPSGRRKRPDGMDSLEEDAVDEEPNAPDIAFETRRRKKPKAVLPDKPELGRMQSQTEVLQRLRELEQEVLTLPSPLEAGAEHRDQWAEMAKLNAAIDRTHDGFLCGLNALWLGFDDAAPSFWAWANKGERVAGGWQGRRVDEPWTVGQLDELLALKKPALSDLAALSGHLAWAGQTSEPLPALAQRMGAVQRFLEDHEPLLPIRATWLAWLGCFKHSRRDVLTLARARDRALERLFQGGLSVELDLPTFLRFSGDALNDRFRAVRDKVLKMHGVVHEWLDSTRGFNDVKPTRSLTDLMFAYALGRLGEPVACHELMEKAVEDLILTNAVPPTSTIHWWIAEAFKFRVQEALEGRFGNQLPLNLLEVHSQMERDPKYVVDRMRELSRILEPHERIEPYRRFRMLFSDDLDRDLAVLCDINDRAELTNRLTHLLNSKAATQPSPAARTLTAALEVAPRLGQAFAESLLDKVEPVLQRKPTTVEQLFLLQKALYAAAHFDQPGHLQTFVGRFHEIIDSDTAEDIEKALEGVVEQCFTGLRKLGMRDEISKILEKIDARARREKPAKGKPKPPDSRRVEQLKLRLHVAAGSFYFGQPDRAWPILDEVRTLLFEGDLNPNFQNSLACAYIVTLAHAPIDASIERLTELFQTVDRIAGIFLTDKYYSRSQLNMVEALVLALISDDFTLDKAGRRWLDDDEYLVRKKIHADVRAAMAGA